MKTICFTGIALAVLLLSSASRVSAGERGWLGITVQNLSQRDAFRLGLEASGGVMVTMVRQGGPSARAGVMQGDIIIEFDGQPVDDVSRLKRMIGKRSPGSRVTLKIIRDRSETSLSVLLGREPKEAA